MKRLEFVFHCCPSIRLVRCNGGAQFKSLPMARATDFTTVAAAEAVIQNPEHCDSRKSRKRARRESPEKVLGGKLDWCSKTGDLNEALRLYSDAKSSNLKLDVQNYNVLLYLCSHRSGDSDSASLDKGFEILNQMNMDNVKPNEATFTNASRLAAGKKDPDLAFRLIKSMKDHSISPRLRSYSSALFGFCDKGEADKAYEVDKHMTDSAVSAEEPELSALLKISFEVKREDKVYEMMHRLRATVRQVSDETAAIIESWFNSEEASLVGVENWDAVKVKEGVVEGGGGWHGQGWLGSGKWRVCRTRMNDSGVCGACGEKLVCIDIEPKEMESFALSLVELANKKGLTQSFVQFQEWLEKHGPFDAVVDGANIGLANRLTFTFSQIRRVVKELQRITSSKRLPLIVLHQSRVHGGPAQHPNNKKMLDYWRDSGALYATPVGSNDDWYWLYAAVSSKCLLVTNDEMRDHLFTLLGNSFFPRWKEKHQRESSSAKNGLQVRIKVDNDGIRLKMPPPYSVVIQESEQGSWHVPTVRGDDLEAPREWICATRRKTRSRAR
ncbi:hypothetical protein M569_07653 [Genlisea aurea]|uniref:ribonuclease P n=1 Tax=Genlisea aurea TaxID=192259 RepID=S8CJB4_9LAMI|nr:hypothetical protein M569_07653 [Genlisea aurea]